MYPAPLGSEVHGFARKGEAMPLTNSHQGSWVYLEEETLQSKSLLV
jgi:hypothetical protein